MATEISANYTKPEIWICLKGLTLQNTSSALCKRCMNMMLRQFWHQTAAQLACLARLSMASMASSSSSKRKACDLELVSLGRASYASHSAISKLLAHISEHGLPETYDRSAQFRARKEICRKDVNGYGPLVVDRQMAAQKGGYVTGTFQNPIGCFRISLPTFSSIRENCEKRICRAPTFAWVPMEIDYISRWGGPKRWPGEEPFP